MTQLEQDTNYKIPDSLVKSFTLDQRNNQQHFRTFNNEDIDDLSKTVTER